MKYEEKVVQAIFILASLLWISREFLLKIGRSPQKWQTVQ